MNTMLKQYERGGFTIVELLIVVVVIAILAAISVIAFNGIQQRANNAAIINAASQSFKAIQLYIADKGMLPASGYACITTQTGCHDGNNSIGSNSTFDAGMMTIGTLPKSVPRAGTGYGITYHADNVRTFNGAPRRGVLLYFLKGSAQQCGLPDVANIWGDAMVSSTTGYSDSQATWTSCIISIPS